MPLKPKVVVTFGMRHKMAEYIVEWTEHLASKKDLCAEDLRQSLKDPLKDNQVQHEMDASNAQTFVAVMAQPHFPSVVKKCLQKLSDDSVDVIVGMCKSGFHRADTFGRVTMAAGNCVLDEYGEHALTVLHVPLIKCTKRDTIDGAFNQIMSFLEDPWLDGFPFGVQRHNQFGYGFAQSSREAFKNFNEIWDCVEAWNPRCAAASEENSPKPHRRRRRRTKAIDLTLDMRPQSPSRPAPKRSLADTEEAETEESVPPPPWKRAPPPPPPPRPPLNPPPAHLVAHDEEPNLHDVYWSDFAGYVEESTKQWNVPGPVELGQAWTEVLTSYKVDDYAQQELFAFSQTNKEGYEGALNVIMNLIKKFSDGVHVRSPSAFVHTSILVCRFGPEYQQHRRDMKASSSSKDTWK